MINKEKVNYLLCLKNEPQNKFFVNDINCLNKSNKRLTISEKFLKHLLEYLQKEYQKKMSLELKDKVVELIVDFCNNLGSFTSLDISNKVKCNFPSIRHREVAFIVRSLYSDGFMETYDFNRTIINVTLSSGNVAQAYLYHHQSVSPDSYNSRSQVATKLQQDNTQLSTFTSTILTVNDNNFIQSRKQKGDCRLEIPISWVRHLGWNEDSIIYVVHETGIVLRDSDNISSTDNILITTTICNGRLRVPKTAFIKAGFTNNSPGSSHSVYLKADEILISDI